MLFQGPRAAPMYFLKRHIKFRRAPPPPSNLEKPLLSPMFSTENLGQTSMLVTSNFQRGKIQPKRFFFLLLLLFMTYPFS